MSRKTTDYICWATFPNGREAITLHDINDNTWISTGPEPMWKASQELQFHPKRKIKFKRVLATEFLEALKWYSCTPEEFPSPESLPYKYLCPGLIAWGLREAHKIDHSEGFCALLGHHLHLWEDIP